MRVMGGGTATGARATIADLLTGAAGALIVVFVLAGILFPPHEWPAPHHREVPRAR